MKRKPRLGRPPAANKAKNRLTLFLTDADLARVDADRGDLPAAAYLRLALESVLPGSAIDGRGKVTSPLRNKQVDTMPEVLPVPAAGDLPGHRKPRGRL